MFPSLPKSMSEEDEIGEDEIGEDWGGHWAAAAGAPMLPSLCDIMMSHSMPWAQKNPVMSLQIRMLTKKGDLRTGLFQVIQAGRKKQINNKKGVRLG